MKIMVTGGEGLVGSSLKRLGEETQHQIVTVSRKDADLTDRNQVNSLFKKHRPDYVIHAAARVGGIGRNLETPANQFTENILMNTHVIDAAYQHGVKKLIAYSSVCAFPSDLNVLSENKLQDGPPYPAHGAYAYSKRMVDVQIEAYRKQYGVQYCSIIPGNIFGENDNFNLKDGHVVPSLIHKAYLAKKNGTPLSVWGDGTPLREFIYVDDLSRVCLSLLDIDNIPQKLLVSGTEFSIKQIVELVAKFSGVEKIEWDSSKPNGQLRRPTDKTLFKQYFPDSITTSVELSIEKTVNWFFENYESARK